MYAIIKTGGKQYRVTEGQIINVEKIESDSQEPTVRFDEVLMVIAGEKAHIGAPCLADAHVTGEIIAQKRHKKIEIIKFKRRKHHLKHQGHRQYYTQVRVTGISVKG